MEEEGISLDRLAKLHGRLEEKVPLQEIQFLLTPEGLVYEGERLADFAAVTEKLGEISNPYDHYISMGITTEDISLKQFREATENFVHVIADLGFDHFSDIGLQPLGEVPPAKTVKASARGIIGRAGVDGTYTAEFIAGHDAAYFLDRIAKPDTGYSGFAGLWAAQYKAATATEGERKKIVDMALTLAEDPSKPFQQRFQCCYLASSFEIASTIPRLSAILENDDNSQLRTVAACALGQFESKEARDRLKKLIVSEPEHEIRSWITRALDGEFPRSTVWQPDVQPVSNPGVSSSPETRTTNARLRNDCANRLKQLGLVMKMFSNESRGSKFPRPDGLRILSSDINPEYFTSPNLLICPANDAAPEKGISRGDQTQWHFDHSSYWYIAHAIMNEKQGLAYIKAFRKTVEEGDGNLDINLAADIMPGGKIYRTREGIERFFITDINDPRATYKSQSTIPVLIERVGNHEPEGGHVLFMDGHVEYLRYPGEFPMTKAFIEGLQSLENVSKAVGEEAAVAPNAIASEEPQESRIAYAFGDGIPKRTPDGEVLVDVRAIAITAEGMPVASTMTSLNNIELIEFDGEQWTLAFPFPKHVSNTRQHSEVASKSGRAFYGDPGVTIVAKVNLAAKGAHLKATEEALWQRPGPDGDLKIFEAKDEIIRALAATESGMIAIGTSEGLYIRAGKGEPFEKTYPADTRYSWTPREVRALAFDSVGRLWIGCEQGVGALNGESWTLYTEAEGLPDAHFTCAASGKQGAVWFGTDRGAAYLDGQIWTILTASRWLPDNAVRDIAIDSNGDAWIATLKGISHVTRDAIAKNGPYYTFLIDDDARVSNEASALASLRTISTALASYQASGVYPSLKALGTGGALTDKQLGSGSKDGYTFQVSPRLENGISQYTATAIPLVPGVTGVMTFFVDESGVIRFDSSGNIPTYKSPPVK